MERPIKSQSSVYWNNVEARTNTSIVPLKACHYPTRSNLKFYTNNWNSISMQYTAAGTFTLGGFTTATSYNCSISASNSQGSGPATYLINTTQEARKSCRLHRYIFCTQFAWNIPMPTLVILVRTSLLSS